MKPFVKMYLPKEAFDPQMYIKNYGVSLEDAEHLIQEQLETEVMGNGDYQVNIRDIKPEEGNGWPALTHLSIKRVDKEIIRDWRVLQEIKNAILGEECEAIELYPAESRLVDTANQYHLWGFRDPEMRFPFGWSTRLVLEGSIANSKQRAFNADS